MTGSTGSCSRYRIILRGECKHLLTGLLDALLVESGHGWTCVIATVRDESELYGLLERFQEFALHIVSLNEDDNIGEFGLDARTHAMVCLAALVAAGERETAYDQQVATALDHGVTPDEIAGVLVALLPTVGAARVTAAAPAIHAAIERLAGDTPAGPASKSA